MHKKLAIAFAVSVGVTMAVGVGTIIGHIFVGYAALAVMIEPLVYAYAVVAVVGLFAASTAPKGKRLNAWINVGLWSMWFAMMLGQLRYPSNELREAIEARAN